MKRRAMVMVAALALAGGACGGDDDGDVTDGAAATSEGASATSEGASATSDGASATSDGASATSDDAGGSADATVTAVTADSTADTLAGADDGGTVVDVGLVRVELVRQLILSGMTEVQATCMADNLDMEEVAANGANDLMMFIELFETCGVDASKLTQPGP